MRSYFARHTERLLLRDEDLRRFWKDKIAVHYPGDTERTPDRRSLEPEAYSGTGKTTVRYLRDLEKDGGYVWAESRVSSGAAKVVGVKPGTPVEIDEPSIRRRRPGSTGEPSVRVRRSSVHRDYDADSASSGSKDYAHVLPTMASRMDSWS